MSITHSAITASPHGASWPPDDHCEFVPPAGAVTPNRTFVGREKSNVQVMIR